MVRKYKALFIILIVTGAACLVLNGPAYASNATRMIAFSSRDSGMAGATTASSEDTSCLIKNPAGLVRIGNRVDVEYQNIIPHDVMMHTEGQVITPPVSLSNRTKTQKSTVTYLPGGNAGISCRIPGTDAHPVAVGIGMFTMAGIAVDYPTSRMNTLLINNGVFDKQIDLRSMRITPGLAVGLTDNLSIGAVGNIIIQGLRTDLIKASDFRETGGKGKWDFVPGGGFTVGLLYKFNEMLNLGASYESHGWTGFHRKYKDVLHFIDEPPVINVGLSFKPIKNFEFTYDTRYINWTNVKIAERGPLQGGFGWRDQWVFATGAEYTAWDKLKLRMGYMYGRSPIQPHVVFANALFPVVSEHHLTMGFSYFFTKNFSVDVAWEHHFYGEQEDDGTGDVYSRNGIGSKIGGAGEIIGVGIGYKF